MSSGESRKNKDRKQEKHSTLTLLCTEESPVFFGYLCWPTNEICSVRVIFLSSLCRSFSFGMAGETTPVAWQFCWYWCNVVFFCTGHVHEYRNLMNIKSTPDCSDPISVALVLKWKTFVVFSFSDHCQFFSWQHMLFYFIVYLPAWK